MIKGFILYGSLISPEMIEEVLRNSLIVKLIQVYQSEKVRSKEEDLKKWLKGWEGKLDKISPKLLGRTLSEYSINI